MTHEGIEQGSSAAIFVVGSHGSGKIGEDKLVMQFPQEKEAGSRLRQWWKKQKRRPCELWWQ